MIFDTRAPYWAIEIGIAGFKVHRALAMRIGLLEFLLSFTGYKGIHEQLSKVMVGCRKAHATTRKASEKHSLARLNPVSTFSPF